MSGTSFSGLPSLSSKQIVQALKRADFKPRGKAKGSHQVFRGTVGGQPRNVTVKLGEKDTPRTVLGSIIRNSGLTPAEFLAFVK